MMSFNELDVLSMCITRVSASIMYMHVKAFRVPREALAMPAEKMTSLWVYWPCVQVDVVVVAKRNLADIEAIAAKNSYWEQSVR